jgi:hypothetical protein
MTTNRAAIDLFATRIPIDGWAGLPLLGIAAVLALVLPGALAILLGGLAGGSLLAWSLIHRRRG